MKCAIRIGDSLVAIPAVVAVDAHDVKSARAPMPDIA